MVHRFHRVTHAVVFALLGLFPVALIAGFDRTGVAAAENAQSAPAAVPAATSTLAAQSSSNPRPHRPKLRAGIDEGQLKHATIIVETGQEMKLPKRAYVVAVATAMQESELRVLANVNVPHSFDYKPRDGYGRDHDSVGLFQQRVPYYCVNDVKFCMDPRYSAIKFYNGLKGVSGWEQLPVTVAAQRVQGSAFPDHYAKHQGAAELIVDSILEWQDH